MFCVKDHIYIWIPTNGRFLSMLLKICPETSAFAAQTDRFFTPMLRYFHLFRETPTIHLLQCIIKPSQNFSLPFFVFYSGKDAQLFRVQS